MKVLGALDQIAFELSETTGRKDDYKEELFGRFLRGIKKDQRHEITVELIYASMDAVKPNNEGKHMYPYDDYLKRYWKKNNKLRKKD
jgi:hypothetical protein